ncbi:GumC family protein [Occallatibacter savannae]|uniref:GumC family protein n=1 Tax=Occallatibacter savannae TaxID=1002691 RepID=UPI000D69D57F|nr:polysaccharide biosynthesis tyrosine autokinase [Occallatibacter savannae]
MQQEPRQISDTFSSTNRDPSSFPGNALGVDDDPIQALLRFLKKRGWVILGVVALGFIAAIATNHFQRKLYTAQASIEIRAQDMSSQFRLEQVPDIAASVDTSERLDTEIEILRSRDLAFETIRALHLESNPDFLPLENGHPWDLSKAYYRHVLVSVFLGQIQVSRLGHTSIIDIAVTSKSPELASLIANTLVDRYIEHSFRDNYAATVKVSGWLDSKLNSIKTNLENSQKRILDLQRDIGVYGIDQSHSIISANLEELNKQYADAEVDRLLKESRLQQMRSSSPDVIDAALGNADPALQAVKQRLVQAQAEYNSLIQTYGPEYPRVKTLNAQMNQLQTALASEEKAQVTRFQKEFEASQNHEKQLRAALEQQEQQVFGVGQKAMQYELAKQDYETNRLLYDGLQQRLQEAGIVSGLHSTAVHIVDNADTPVAPSWPRKRFNVALGLGGGFFIGLCLAILLEVMDTNLKTITDVEQNLNLPLIAAIPRVDSEHLLAESFRDHAASKGVSSWSRIAEALRGMRTSILLSSPGSAPKVILIVSTRPAEGKSSVASLAAITFALNGSKVLLLDADLRRPSVHLRFRISKAVGLSSVLSGKARFEEAIVDWPPLPNLHILPSGPVPPLPSELLGSREMQSLLSRAREEYDIVIVDTPPVLAVTDASLLARLADATILIVRYDMTRKQVVLRGAEMLERAGAHLLGVAINAVDLASPDYTEYYGSKYYQYYGERDPNERA